MGPGPRLPGTTHDRTSRMTTRRVGPAFIGLGAAILVVSLVLELILGASTFTVVSGAAALGFTGWALVLVYRSPPKDP